MAPFASSASPDCYYRVLGVDRAASEADLTRAYRRLALKHHPDKNREDPQGAEEKFKRITEAYDVLRDPERRRAYDQLGKAGLEGCGGFPGRGAASRGGGVSSEEAERILRAVFGDSDFAGLFGTPGGDCKGPATFFFQPDCAGPGPPPGRGTGGFGGFGCGDGVGGNSPAAQYALQGGTEVVVHGLINAAERNGRRGKVLAWDQVRARYRVELEDGTSLLRAQNITQLCRIEVVGLVSKPELNGCCGRVLFYDDERGRYQVLLSSPSLALGLQPANCIFEQGTRVVLQGLSKVELNGTMARILEVDRAALRYTVECQGLRRFKVKLENVRC